MATSKHRKTHPHHVGRMVAAFTAGIMVTAGSAALAATSGGSAVDADVCASAQHIAVAVGGTAGICPTISPSPTPTPTLTVSPTATVSPSPTNTPTPAPSATPTITSSHAFGPPAMTNPVVLQLADSSSALKLDVTKDYLLECPASGVLHNTTGLTVSGGRNVVLQHCIIDVGNGGPGLAPLGNELQKRGAYLLAGGEFYGEDLAFRSSIAGHLTEGIDLAGGSNKVTLQGITMDPLVGGLNANHADCLQAWDGPSVLDVDGFTCVSGYQCMFLLPNQHDATLPISDWDLRNVSITAAYYALWRDTNIRTLTHPAGYIIHTINFTVSGNRVSNGLPAMSPDSAAWPDVIVH